MSDRKKHIVRVVLNTGDHIRRFFWVAQGSDRSIYFASSNSNNYKRGFSGNARATEKGATIIPEQMGRPMNSDEIKENYSFHRSGILILPTKNGEYRVRHSTQPLPDYNDPIPLVGILPMHISKYPVISKPVSEPDIILNVFEHIQQPFAVTLYLKKISQVQPKVARKKKNGRITNIDALHWETSNYALFYMQIK